MVKNKYFDSEEESSEIIKKIVNNFGKFVDNFSWEKLEKRIQNNLYKILMG